MNMNDPSHRFHFVLSLGGQWAHIWTLTSNSLRLPHFSSQCLWWLSCFRYISYSSGMCELSQFPSNAMPRANQVPFSISILWRNLTMFPIMQIYAAICELENLANFCCNVQLVLPYDQCPTQTQKHCIDFTVFLCRHFDLSCRRGQQITSRVSCWCSATW